MGPEWIREGYLQKEKRRKKSSKLIRNLYLAATISCGGLFFGSTATSFYYSGKSEEYYANEYRVNKDIAKTSGLGLLLLGSHWSAYLYGARRRKKNLTEG